MLQRHVQTNEVRETATGRNVALVAPSTSSGVLEAAESANTKSWRKSRAHELNVVVDSFGDVHERPNE